MAYLLHTLLSHCYFSILKSLQPPSPLFPFFYKHLIDDDNNAHESRLTQGGKWGFKIHRREKGRGMENNKNNYYQQIMSQRVLLLLYGYNIIDILTIITYLSNRISLKILGFSSRNITPPFHAHRSIWRWVYLSTIQSIVSVCVDFDVS